ncbi:MAG: hypothetical protein VB144_11475 [Clostridia bacterium]|nr:hypothetical protein [Clostridia bacterium]
MGIKIFPSANAVGGATQKVLKEINLAGWMMPGARNYVVSGFNLPSQVEGSTLPITAGVAVIAGYCVVTDAPINLQMPQPTMNNNTYAIYLCLTRDGIGLATGATASYSTTGPPAGDYIKLGTVREAVGGYNYGDNTAPNAPWPSLVDVMRPGSIYYSTRFDSVYGFAETGTAVCTERHVELTTAAQSGASSTLRKECPATTHFDTSRPYFIRMGIGYDSYSAVTGYAGIGTPASKQFVGISYRDGYIYGAHGDGTSLVETAELSTSGAGNTTANKEIIITVAGGVCRWQVTQGSACEATSNLPIYLGDDAIFYAEVKTTDANARKMYISHWAVLQVA